MKKLIIKIIAWIKWFFGFAKKEEVIIKTDLQKFTESTKDLINRVENVAKAKTEVISNDIMVFDETVKKFVALPGEVKDEIVKKVQEELSHTPELFTGESTTGNTTVNNSDKAIVTTITGEQKVVSTKKYGKKAK